MPEAHRPRNGVHLRDDIGADDLVRILALIWSILSFNIETLIPFAQLKYQGLDICMSKLNCALLSSYAVAIFLCCASLAASTDPRFLALYPLWVPILSHISLLLGVLATALLLIIVVPPLGWLVFLVWLLFLAKMVRKTGAQFYRLVREPIVGVISNLVAGFIDWFGFGLGHVGLAHHSQLGRSVQV